MTESKQHPIPDLVPSAERLAGKVALVTGAGSRTEGIGNGRAIAIRLAQEGAKVGLVDTEQWALDQTMAYIEQVGGAAMPFVADVTQSADIERVVETLVSAYGGLDILVNNVGISGPSGTAVEVDADEWDTAMQVNLKSMMLTSKFAIPEMRKRAGGSIINISSVGGLRGGHPDIFYPTSKGGTAIISQVMAGHHGTENIRVNAIAPGMVSTPLVQLKFPSPEQQEARRKRSLLKTVGTAWDIAAGAAYLASDDARWVTGVILPIDAGSSAVITRGW